MIPECFCQVTDNTNCYIGDPPPQPFRRPDNITAPPPPLHVDATLRYCERCSHPEAGQYMYHYGACPRDNRCPHCGQLLREPGL